MVYDSYLDAIEDFVKHASSQELQAVFDVVDPYLASDNCDYFDISLFGGDYRLEDDGISNSDFLNAIKRSIEQKKASLSNI
ncbi:hypothetical protein QA646_30190 (plasmid) [Rhizobium sp. CB3090]|uniref:hypothetical protein n=1 Tax=Rhizobium sp. CB3090 TaxID=3039156 RepID=UPI0024B17F60|nr:hypothetical protein [Rhizobium sp. CB3090]WFU13264.1 hypothetical protein QA646_30190 [Rhizobium sp. CB3090]